MYRPTGFDPQIIGGIVLMCAMLSTEEAAAKVRTAAKNPLRVPNVVRLIPGRGTLGLPGLLTSTDVIIGDSTVSYIDPEFLDDERLMVWQDGTGEVWTCHVDPDTGNMLPPDGKGHYAGHAAPLLTKANPLFDVTYNGPEFGWSQQGIVVYYSQFEGLDILRYNLTTQQIDMPFSGKTQNTRALISSKERTFPGTLVMYARIGDANNRIGKQIFNEWFDDSEPEVVHEVPRIKAGTSGPQWIPGQRAILAQYPDSKGIDQVCRYDIDTKAFTILTDTPGNKIDSFPFEAPEYPGEILFLTLNERKHLEVYRSVNGRSIRILRLPAPETTGDTSSGMKSAEPVIFQGKTYFTYLADYQNQITRIAFAALDGQISTWISPAGPLDQFDPEGVVLDDHLYVYYYDGVNTQNIHTFHRCEILLW